MRRVIAFAALVVLVGLPVLAGAGLALAAFTAHFVTPQTITAADKFGPKPPTPTPPTPTPPTPGDDLEIQSRTNDGGASGNRVLFGLRLRSTGDKDADLKKVELRYWFTDDGGSGAPTAACYQAEPGCHKVTLTASSLDPPREGADYYLAVHFQSGKLKPGADTTLEQLAILAPPGATYRQDNDFSFLNKASFTDNPRVTAYINNKLVWGTEP